ncbi:MAG: AAA family ATPase [Thermomonas hydrothermalis]|uniref:AAA family ATPase n=1 Tax=Thermomonas hydrothermalis TaxID=213588 RepID=UPI002357C901|nr:AAA family ATPase [Thermomonas hydrothermalis]MCL6619466.1 AAA family ATPase [Thermomonas hydrothermalis]
MDDILNQVRRLIEAGDVTQARVAKEAGVSATSLSQVLAGKYAADPSAVVERLSAWLAARAERAASALPEMPAFVVTPTAQRVLAALSYAQMAADVAVVYGAAGVGKTTAISEYAKTRPSVWVAVMTPGHAGVTAALEEVAFAVGLKDLPQSPARLHREIVARVRGTGGLIVVDEAQHLGVAALDALRSIHDAADVGLALVGNDLLYGRMTGGTRAAYLDRLFSRIGKRVSVRKATDADIEAVAKAAGGEAWGVVKDVGRQAGALRAVVKVLRLARMMAQAAGETLTAAHVAAARRDLEGV